MKNIFIIFIVIFTVSLSRIIPHPYNFTPVMALGILGGCFINNIFISIALTLGSMFVSDLFIGMHSSMPFVYVSLLITLFMSRLIKDNHSLSKVAVLSLISSIQFFLITNFSVWMFWSLYPKSLLGLIECYVVAIPFLRNAIAGDLLYSTVLYTTVVYLLHLKDNQLVTAK